MTELEKYRATIKLLGLTEKEICKQLGITMISYKSSTQPSRKFPRWAKAIMLGAKYQRKIISEQLNIKNNE